MTNHFVVGLVFTNSLSGSKKISVSRRPDFRAALSGMLKSTSSIAQKCVIFGFCFSHFRISLHRFSRKDECKALMTPGVAWSKSGVELYSFGMPCSSKALPMPSTKTSCFRQSDDKTIRASVFWTMNLAELAELAELAGVDVVICDETTGKSQN